MPRPAQRPLHPPDRGSIRRLQDIPNVGPATVGDFHLLGIHRPEQLIGRDPYALYDELCAESGQRHDPCVYDVFIAAVRFMEGGPATVWWKFTAERKAELKRRQG
jgi:hypothetical protein